MKFCEKKVLRKKSFEVSTTAQMTESKVSQLRRSPRIANLKRKSNSLSQSNPISQSNLPPIPLSPQFIDDEGNPYFYACACQGQNVINELCDCFSCEESNCIAWECEFCYKRSGYSKDNINRIKSQTVTHYCPFHRAIKGIIPETPIKRQKLQNDNTLNVEIMDFINDSDDEDLDGDHGFIRAKEDEIYISKK